MLGKRKRCSSPPPSLPSPPNFNFNTASPSPFNSSPISTPSHSAFSSFSSPVRPLEPSSSSFSMPAKDRLRGESSCRTQKRTRNRGDERGIYENTLRLLFGASKAQSKPTKSTTASTSTMMMVIDETPRCEDCEGYLAEEELFEVGEGRCMGCQKRVCKAGGCCVETGNGRVCLECALR